VGGYALRAREDSVRPRRLVGAFGRPLNFTVGRRPRLALFDRVASLCDDGICISAFLATSPMWRPSPQGSGIREIARMRKRYGRGRRRKRKGTVEIELPGGEIVLAELHWYEATGIGRREFKIKCLLKR
jgi:hypothetical protein